MARNKSQRAVPAAQRQEDADDGTSIDLDMFLNGDVKETATARWPGAVTSDTDLDEILSPPPRAPAEAPAAESAKPPPSTHHKLDKVLKIGTARPTRASKIRKYVIWAALLGGLVYVAFLPYPYTVGGDFVVQPVARHQVRARTAGEIIKLNIESGQWLKQDDIIAVLANWDEDRDVGLSLADLARLKADLQTLIAGPKPEEIRLAEQQLKGTETKLTEAKQQLDRKKQLYDTKVASLKDLEDAQNNYDLALSERGQAQAKLDLLKSPVLPSEVDAAQAKITHKQEEVDYNKLQLEHTYVRAPISGQIITTLDNITVGSYVREGDIITEIADQRTVEVSIDVPETDVNESVIGASVTLKLWSAPNESITGTVKSISPIAEQRDYGRIVSVTVVVPNPKGTLARNMTGYGKINVGDRPVWEVFTKAIVRFVQIEMWSWLP